MKKLLLPIIVFIFFIPLAALPQSDEESLNRAVDKALGHWKRNFASPAYGIALFPGNVHLQGLPGVSSTFSEKNILIPAVDLRIFRGVNVAKRGGFYTGIEAGVFIFLPTEKSFNDTATVDDLQFTPGVSDFTQSYKFNVAAYGGVVFLMAKYGLRMDVGPPAIGLSAGFEVGAGGSIYTGGFDVWVGDKDTPTAQADSGIDETKLSLIVDGSVEGAFRIRKNFRMFMKGSVIITPLVFRNELKFNPVLDPVGPPQDTEYFGYALNNYEVELDVFAYDLRVGFIVNFD